VEHVIDRDAAKDELAEFAGVGDLFAVLDALVEAGLVHEIHGIAGTRFVVRKDREDGEDGDAPHPDPHDFD
jgi:hypothetical protein